MIAYIPLLFALVGILLYFICATNPKLSEVGRLMFVCGLLVFLFTLATRTVSFMAHGDEPVVRTHSSEH